MLSRFYLKDSVWHFIRDYKKELPGIIGALRDGTYQFEPVRKIEKSEGPPAYIWMARDAFVLKSLSLYLTDVLVPQFSSQCVNIKGNGGISAGLSQVSESCDEYKFVFRSDIFSYYESMSHNIILRLMKKYTRCKKILSLFARFLNHLEDHDGELISITKGISKGCPLSPVIGGLYLSELDFAMSKFPVVYIRFADDWCVLAKKRWTLRKAIKGINQILNRLKVIKHPDKTFIGKVSKGFSFLGFHLNSQGIIDLAFATKEKVREKLHRLYEHGCDVAAVHKYLKHWSTWVRTAIAFSIIPIHVNNFNSSNFSQSRYFEGFDFQVQVR